MDGSVEFLNSELSKFGWDSKQDLVILKKWDILQVLNKYIKEDIKQREVESWAEALECREDIDFDVPYKKLISKIIFELANPDISGELSEMKAKTLIKKLI